MRGATGEPRGSLLQRDEGGVAVQHRALGGAEEQVLGEHEFVGGCAGDEVFGGGEAEREAVAVVARVDVQVAGVEGLEHERGSRGLGSEAEREGDGLHGRRGGGQLEDDVGPLPAMQDGAGRRRLDRYLLCSRSLDAGEAQEEEEQEEEGRVGGHGGLCVGRSLGREACVGW